MVSAGRGFIWYNAQIQHDVDKPKSNSTSFLKLDHVIPGSILGAITAHAVSPSTYIPMAAIAVAVS